MNTEIEYTEKQRLHKLVLLPIFVLLTGTVLFVFYKKYFPGENPNGDQVLNSGLGIITVIFFLIMFLLYSTSLTTTFSKKSIQIKFTPLFINKHILWSEIKSAELIKYDFVGYGFRLGTKYGTVYNMKGNKGIKITTLSGKRYLVGVQGVSKVEKILISFLKER